MCYKLFRVFSFSFCVLSCLVLIGCPPSGGVAVPNVIGITQANAQNAIVAAGLAVGNVGQQSSNTVAAGLVISQSPQPGASVSAGSTVNITVSTGPALADLPTHNFTTDTTLPAGNYLATANVYVSGGILTLSPGVTIYFQQSTRMDVTQSGRLNAVGTQAAPIVLTGEEETRGFWGGVRIYNSNSINNQLQFVTIQYGGGYWDANLELAGSSSNPTMVGIQNCTFRQSENFGLAMDENSSLSACAANAFTENALGAAAVEPESAGYLDDTSSYSGNDAGMDIVVVDGGSVSTDATWPGIDAVYRATGTLTVLADLVFDPGVYIEFESGVRMDVTSGSLWAVGTALQPIVLTGQEASRAYWGGLRFYQSNSVNNRLEHVYIEYGGSYWQANVEVRGSSIVHSQLAIVNCTLQESGEYGLYCDQYVNLTAFSNNVLTANTEGAAYMDAEVVRFLDGTTTYLLNDYDVVEVGSGNVDTDATWPAIDGAYLITSSPAVYGALTLEPGAILMFASGSRMTVDGGTLIAVGTALDPILFTGEQQTTGYWGGLRLNNTNDPANQLAYCTIEYGGSYYDANLYLTGSSINPTQATVTNCHFANSGTWGIKLTNYVTTNSDIATVNTFANNTLGNVDTP